MAARGGGQNFSAPLPLLAFPTQSSDHSGTMVPVRFEVCTASEVTRLSLVGNCMALGGWDLAHSLPLSYGSAGRCLAAAA